MLILSFFIICLIIGVISYPEGFKDFMSYRPAANNGLILFATIFATSWGSASTFGLIDKLYANKYEYAIAYIFSLTWIIIVSKVFVPRIIKLNGKTIAEIFGNIYGNKGQILIGAFSAIFSLGHFAAQITVCGFLFELLTGLSPIKGILISYILVIVYSTYGGIASVIKTDIFQLVIMCIGLAAFAYAFKKSDITIMMILDNTQNIVSNNQYTPINGLSLGITFCVMTFYPAFIQRVMLTDRIDVIQKALNYTIISYFMFIITVFIIASYSKVVLNGPESYKDAITYIANKSDSYFIREFTILGAIACILSTADSDLNIATVTTCQDIIMPIKKVADKPALYLARFISVSIGVLALYASTYFVNLLELAMFVAGFWSPVIFAPFIAIIYNKYINFLGVILVIISGISSFILWQYFYIGPIKIPAALIGCMVNIISYVVLYQIKYFRVRQ